MKINKIIQFASFRSWRSTLFWSLELLVSLAPLMPCSPVFHNYQQLPPEEFLEIHLASFLGRSKPLRLAENFFVEKRPKHRANVFQPNLENHTLTSWSARMFDKIYLWLPSWNGFTRSDLCMLFTHGGVPLCTLHLCFPQETLTPIK